MSWPLVQPPSPPPPSSGSLVDTGNGAFYLCVPPHRATSTPACHWLPLAFQRLLLFVSGQSSVGSTFPPFGAKVLFLFCFLRPRHSSSSLWAVSSMMSK